MITKDQSLRTLESLGPAPVFISAYHMPPLPPGRVIKRLPYHLDICFGPPEEFFTMTPDEQRAYDEGGKLIPLLDDGNFDTVLFLDTRSGEFVLKSVEEPDTPISVFKNWQQYLADLFRDIADSGVENGELRSIAEEIGFRYAERALEIFSSPDLPREERRANWAAFLRTIGP